MTNTKLPLKTHLASSSIAIFMGQYNNRREWEAIIQPFMTHPDPKHARGVDRYEHIVHRDPKEAK